MSYTVVNGQELFYSYNGDLSPSGEYSFTKVHAKPYSDVSRPKPKGLEKLSSQTYWTHYVTTRQRAMAGYNVPGYYYSGPNSYNAAPFDHKPEEMESARVQATTKLLAKIKGEQWNLSTFLGELPETLRYLGKTVDTVVRLYRAVKRGDMREVRKLGKQGRKTKRPDVAPGTFSNELSGRWLEWRYAIQPMMYDLQDALKALYDSQTRPLWMRVASGGTSFYNDVELFAQVGSAKVYSISQSTGQVRVGCYFRVNPDVQAFKRLGLLNPVATLWELFPLSFVVDWLIPIGDYLGSLDAMVGVEVLSSWTSYAFESSMTVTGYSHALPGEDAGYEWGDSSKASKSSYNRVPAVDFNLPLPSFQLSLNANRVIDALALAKALMFK